MTVGTTPLDPLPVPMAQADSARSAVTDVVALVDALVAARQSGHASHLPSWEGAARATWEDSFWFSQADGAVVIDDLQAMVASIAGVIDAIEDHNLVAAFVDW